MRLLYCLASAKFSHWDGRRPEAWRSWGDPLPPSLWLWQGLQQQPLNLWLHLPQDRSVRFWLPPGDPGSSALRSLHLLGGG